MRIVAQRDVVEDGYIVKAGTEFETDEETAKALMVIAGAVEVKAEPKPKTSTKKKATAKKG